MIRHAPKPSPRGRPRLSRDRIIRTAVGFADENGIATLSMRRLGDLLGVEAMSIYNHVANKDELLDAMVDVVFAEIDLPSDDFDWRTKLHRRALSTRSALSHHRWAISLLTSRKAPGPEALRHLNATAGCLRNAGFSVAMAAHAMALLDSYTQGFALQEASLPLDDLGDMSAATAEILNQAPMASGAFPYLTEMARDLVLQPGYAYGDEFAFGLDVILDGIESKLGTPEHPFP